MKKGLIIILILVISLAAIFFFGFRHVVSPVEEDRPFAENAEGWLDQENETVIIDVEEATEGLGDYALGHQRYADSTGEILAVYADGSYKGEVFSGTYIDENGKVWMRIQQDIDPEDGIIDGFAVVKKEDEKAVAYLFVDEDWKHASSSNIHITWGDNIKDKDNLNTMKFDFSIEENGVYVTRIDTGMDWIFEQELVTGRLFFGDITLKDIKERNYQKTFIALT